MSQGEVKAALAALSRNAAHIEDLLENGTVLQDSFPRAAVQDLRQASAMRAAGPDTWRLHPRLREYLQDHVAQLTPFQQLTVIGPKVSNLRDLREEILNASASRDRESVRLLMDSMASVIFDIADSTERNLSFLTNMVSLRYGAVQDLASKQRQNRWYDRQATVMSLDLAKLGQTVADLAHEAEVLQWDVAPLLQREIMARLTGWQHGLSDILSRLSSQIYNLRQIQANLRNLARADTFLSQQLGWRGLDMPAPENVPTALLHAVLGPVRAHVDPMDDHDAVQEAMATAAQALPPPRRARLREPPAPRFLRRDPPADDTTVEEGGPYLQVLRALKLSILHSQEPVSLIDWHRDHEAAAALRKPAATALRPRIWLMLAIWALEGRPHRIEGRKVGFKVILVLDDPLPGRREAHAFHDAIVKVAE